MYPRLDRPPSKPEPDLKATYCDAEVGFAHCERRLILAAGGTPPPGLLPDGGCLPIADQ